MSDSVIIALIVLAGQVWIGILNFLATRRVETKVDAVHKAVNGEEEEDTP